MNIKQKLGLRIKELRKQNGFSQERLAEMIDISQNSLSKIEIGENFFSADTLEKLLPALNISVQQLFDFEHLKHNKELLNDIYEYLNNLDNDKLVIIYKIIQSIAKP